MALLRLFDPVNQFQTKSGALNTAGLLRVYLNGTDDYAAVHDESGTLLEQPVLLDNNGRAPGLFVDSGKVYRLEVQDRYGSLLFTVTDMVPSGGGAGSSIGNSYDVVSSDGSIIVDEFSDGGTTTFDLSLGIDTNELKPSCLKASAYPVTADGQFFFEETANEGTLLSVDKEGKVHMEPAWYHFTAIVELAYDGNPVNKGRRVTLWTTGSSSVVDFDTSYAHRESIELSGDIHVDAANTEFPLGVNGIGDGIRAYLVGFDIHAVTGNGGINEYRAGEGITIANATRTISADFGSVQEKLVAGNNISISGNVISAGNISQEQADWTESDTSSPAYIKHKPDLGVYATRTELNSGLATKQDTISDLSQIRAGAASGATAVQPGNLATVATTGDYNDLDNRPDLGVYATRAEVNTGLAGKQDTISDLAAIRAGSQLGATSVQPDDLGSYATDAELAAGLSTKQDVINDLSEIRSGAAAGSTALQPSDVASVATTGDYDDLSNRPSIPTRTSDLTNDSGFITSADVQVKGVEVDGASVVNAQGVAEITMPDLSGYATTQALDTGLAGKQDVISDLSTIRSGAAAGATAVQPGDLATVATTGSYDDLSGKPDLSVYATGSELTSGLATKQDTISDLAAIRSGSALGATAVQPSDLAAVATSGSYEDLSDKPAIPAAQVQSDWSESDTSSKAYIRNKPDLGVYATDADLSAGLATKQDTIGDLADIRRGASLGATSVQPGDLATVATTGNYDDLTGRPDLSIYAESSNLATVATTGSYNDLAGKPTIPAAQVNSDWNASSGVAEILNKPTLSTVATTGDYDDLVNKPSIPAAQINSDWSEIDTGSKAYIRNKPDLGVYATRTELTDGLAGKQDTVTDLATIRSGAASGATAVQPGDLATVATTGSYYDLADKPDLSVYATGSELTSGLATKQDTISDLATIRSGAAAGSTAVQPGSLATVATTGSYTDLSNTPSIPTATSDLTNDSGFITLSDVPAQVNADWNSSSGASEILNKPTIPSGAQLVPAATSADADKVLTVNAQGTPAWASAQAPITAGNGIDITNNVVSVDTSVVATQTDLAGKEDKFDVGTGLEMDTSGSTPTLQVEAPVDIVAGPGIVIDNPDGNTLRVSVAQAEEVVLYSNNGAAQLPQSTVTLSENASNFEKVVVMYRDRFNNITNSTTFYTDNLTFGGEPTSRILLSAPFLYESANPILARCSQYKFTAGNTLTFESCSNMLYTTTGVTCSYYTAANNQGTFIYKVVGIHRIAGGN